MSAKEVAGKKKNISSVDDSQTVSMSLGQFECLISLITSLGGREDRANDGEGCDIKQKAKAVQSPPPTFFLPTV